MWRIFVIGILITIPVGILEELINQRTLELISPLNPIYLYFIMPFLIVALPEELGKLWVVKKFAFDHHKFNEIMDGITYCILASMGFAILENIIYTIQFGVGTGILRAFTAVPAHALFSGIMGYYIGLAKFKKDKALVRKLFIRGMLAAVILHGLYDALLISQNIYLILLIFPLIGHMWWILNRSIKNANSANKARLAKITGPKFF